MHGLALGKGSPLHLRSKPSSRVHRAKGITTLATVLNCGEVCDSGGYGAFPHNAGAFHNRIVDNDVPALRPIIRVLSPAT